MGHGKHKGFSFHAVPPVPVAWVSETAVTGPITFCNYRLEGDYGGFPYYRREDGARFIWVFAGVAYTISLELGVLGPNHFQRISTEVLGNYSPQGGAVGTAVVAAGRH